MTEPEPSSGEVRVRLALSGVNAGDTKKRGDWLGNRVPFPRIVPHSDGSGVIDAVGQGVDRSRIGHRVWVYGAQSYRPFGTAAELTVVPAEQAVPLPDEVSDGIGACLGIPGITAHRAVFGDGAVVEDDPGPGGAGRRGIGCGAACALGRRDGHRNGDARERP